MRSKAVAALLLGLYMCLPWQGEAAKVADKWQLNVNERYLWGEGTFTYETPDMRALLAGHKGRWNQYKQKAIMPTLRTRVYASYRPDRDTEICLAGEDNRNLRDVEKSHTLHWHRAYVEQNKQHWRYRAGHFGWKQGSGNVLDTDVQGVRLTGGTAKDYVHCFVGRLGKEKDRREGYILEARRTWKKWGYLGAYYNVHKDAAGQDVAWHKQEILSNRLTYSFDKNVSVGYEHLWSRGKTHTTPDFQQYQERNLGGEGGYVLHLQYRDYDYRVPNSYRVRLMYYHQPQSSMIVHTMNGFPGFFDGAGLTGGNHGFALGMRGWGLNFDYILAKGLLLTVEAYDLRNLEQGQYMRDLHQQIIGASLTVNF